MDTTFLETDEIARKLGLLMRDYEEFYWAVAWGSNGPMADRLLQNPDRIVRVVFGTHFCQTDPNLLQRLEPYPAARVMPQSGNGTFHPKVFCFRRGTELAAIIGSANFTRAAADRNAEAAVLLEGSEGDEPLDSALEYVLARWNEAEEISPEFVAAYRRRYNATRAARAKLKAPPHLRRRPRRGVAQQPLHDILEMAWPEYEQTVRGAADAHGVDGRLALLETAQRLLAERRQFASLSHDQRRAIAGIAGRTEVEGIDDWGWFGSMWGFGDLKNRVKENDQHLSAALEAIPKYGEVTREDFDRFCGEYVRAFEAMTRTGDVASASRFLAMKRPDYFVCVDTKNRKRMARDIGFVPTTLDFAKYWETVIEPIMEAPWWGIARPRGDSGRLWDGRVAMLDAIYYRH